MIVTLNLSEFSGHALSNFRIEAQHPDDFALAFLETFPDLVLEAARTNRASLKNPAKTNDEYLAKLDVQRLSRTVSALRELAASGSSAI